MDVIFEHALVAELGVSKEVLKELRRSLLIEGTDYRHKPGHGIEITVSGLEKIRRALAVPAPERSSGPVALDSRDLPIEVIPGNAKKRAPAVVARDFVVVRVFATNLRIVEARREPDDGERVRVRVRASDEMGLRAGSVLPGCVPRPGTEVWNFTGRARL